MSVVKSEPESDGRPPVLDEDSNDIDDAGIIIPVPNDEASKIYKFPPGARVLHVRKHNSSRSPFPILTFGTIESVGIKLIDAMNHSVVFRVKPNNGSGKLLLADKSELRWCDETPVWVRLTGQSDFVPGIVVGRHCCHGMMMDTECRRHKYSIQASVCGQVMVGLDIDDFKYRLHNSSVPPPEPQLNAQSSSRTAPAFLLSLAPSDHEVEEPRPSHMVCSPEQHLPIVQSAFCTEGQSPAPELINYQMKPSQQVTHSSRPLAQKRLPSGHTLPQSTIQQASEPSMEAFVGCGETVLSNIVIVTTSTDEVSSSSIKRGHESEMSPGKRLKATIQDGTSCDGHERQSALPNYPRIPNSLSPLKASSQSAMNRNDMKTTPDPSFEPFSPPRHELRSISLQPSNLLTSQSPALLGNSLQAIPSCPLSRWAHWPPRVFPPQKEASDPAVGRPICSRLIFPCWPENVEAIKGKLIGPGGTIIRNMQRSCNVALKLRGYAVGNYTRDSERLFMKIRGFQECVDAAVNDIMIRTASLVEQDQRNRLMYEFAMKNANGLAKVDGLASFQSLLPSFKLRKWTSVYYLPDNYSSFSGLFLGAKGANTRKITAATDCQFEDIYGP